MKKKIYLTIAAAILFAAISVPAAFAVQNGSQAPPSGQYETQKQINLTDAQKNELKQLYDKRIELDKQIVKKYLDFGVITKEQAERKLKRIDEIKKKIEENGFVPKFHKGKKGEWKDKNSMSPNSDGQQSQSDNKTE